MARDYTLDKKAAMEAGQTSKRISESGLYDGTIKFAWGETNSNGNDLVNLLFVSKEGQECGPIPLYTHNRDGEALYGFKMLNAIMACLKLRTLQTAKGEVTIYDFDSKGEVTKTKDCYPGLTGKPIGLVIQMEEYTGQNGVKKKPTIAGAYDPATRLTATEILESHTTPKLLAGVEKWLADNPVKHERKRAAPAGQPRQAAPADAFDDETIPF